MTFYSDLRDDVAAPLITQFGQDGTYRVYPGATYNNATGDVSNGAATDIAIKLLDLPMKEREFSEEIVARADATLLVAADVFTLPGVSPPVVDAQVIFGSKRYRILAINTIGPAGTAVIYKMAVQNV